MSGDSGTYPELDELPWRVNQWLAGHDEWGQLCWPEYESNQPLDTEMFRIYHEHGTVIKADCFTGLLFALDRACREGRCGVAGHGAPQQASESGGQDSRPQGSQRGRGSP